MSWVVEHAGVTVAALVKERAKVAWSVAKRHVTTGKVFVDGAVITAVDHRLVAGQTVELRMPRRGRAIRRARACSSTTIRTSS